MLSLVCALAVYAVHASWEIPLLACAAALASRWLRRCGPQAEHRVWGTAFVLGVVVPVLPGCLSLLQRAFGGGGPGTVSVTMGADSSGAALPSGELLLPVWLLCTLAAVVLVCGILAVARLLVRLAKTRTLIAASEAVKLPAEKAALWEHAHRSFAAGHVELRSSDRVRGVAAVGWRRPLILVAPEFVESCSEEDFLSAMGHELAHLERGDPARNLLCEAAGVLLAFHPAARWMKAQMARTREMVCDAMAVERLVEPKVYRQSLLRLAQRMVERAPVPALGLFDGNTLEERMKRLRMEKTMLSGPMRTALVMVSALLLALTAASGAMAKGVAAGHSSSDGKVYHPGPGVTNPVLVHAPDPQYSAQARRAKYQGLCVVGLIVDAHGNPQQVHVIRPLGMGLDKKALEAVRQYRFKPALHDGKPVAIAIRIEVNFRIY